MTNKDISRAKIQAAINAINATALKLKLIKMAVAAGATKEQIDYMDKFLTREVLDDLLNRYEQK